MHTDTPSLFERVGGGAAIAKMVESFYARVLADAELAPYFKGVAMDKLQRMQTEFFSAALGGPVKYSGRPIEHAHQHLHISLVDFQRFTKYLFETLAQYALSDQECYEVIGRIN
ncbi:group I truncated hemoglobin, partial [Klebsiella pneumoniae]|uniref:group I truncated hemoglobin n=1 Tax=Klebsiella pneumoniae TaxID=573 RepID=UPI001E299B60